MSSVYYFNKLSQLSLSQKKSLFIICDRKLKPFIKIRKNIYFVDSGESLKDLNSFHLHVKKILKKIQSPPQIFVGIGGGSVTDFSAFFAHLYKRGRELWFVPSTFLSAFDSAHGGKTALNVGGVKNVLGSYHFPTRVYIVKELLLNLDQKEILSAGGELVKMALIEGGSFYSKLKKSSKPSFQTMWEFLPDAIRSKLKIVQRDPFEKKNIRKKLNFGHTLGHCFESYLKIPHGQAVAMGILFSLEWSLFQQYLSQKKCKEIKKVLETFTSVQKIPRQLSLLQLKKLLREDKKLKNSNEIDFVFIKNSGNLFLKPVKLSEITKFYSSLKDF